MTCFLFELWLVAEEECRNKTKNLYVKTILYDESIYNIILCQRRFLENKFNDQR